jgi:hypothetical protein
MGDTTFSGGWIFAFLIIAVLFGGGGFGFGGNAAAAGLATMADVNAAIANQTTQNALGQIALSSANNNYETAQLISGQNMAMMQQANSDLINAIQGFNQVSSSIQTGFASVNQNIANLGFQLDKCCCDIKTTLLNDRLMDAQTKLNQQYTAISNAEQSQYILGQLGTYTPRAAVL